MLSKVFSATTIGLDGVLIDVEVDVARGGFPTLTLVGLPTKAVDEAKDRVRTAVINTGFKMPGTRITVNLAPADIPKEGSSFDLPIALGVLSASGAISPLSLVRGMFVGELSLEGKLRRVPGIIPIAMMAAAKGIENLFVPLENAKEAAIVDGVTVYPVARLLDLVLHLNGQKLIESYPKQPLLNGASTNSEFDFAEVRGQEQAKRALEVAAAGGHNIHLKGVPGAGKTMLSRAFSSILPPLIKQEILEVSRIYSVSGRLNGKHYIATRPFRAPHHTTSKIGLIGGGSKPAPGEISLAHRGVLFLDEFPEFDRSTLEALRQPLEDGFVTVARAAGTLTFPARFQLLAASNPCPCGHLGHKTRECRCQPTAILKYQKKLSGPLLERIDLHVDVSPVEEEKLTSYKAGESSKVIRARVIEARKRQLARFKNLGLTANAQLNTKTIREVCKMTDDASQLLKTAVSTLSLSARSYFKVIKVAQTIADLGNSSKIEGAHVAEALQYRPKEQMSY